MQLGSHKCMQSGHWTTVDDDVNNDNIDEGDSEHYIVNKYMGADHANME